MRKIRLTESDLHNIVKESVKRALKEVSYGAVDRAGRNAMLKYGEGGERRYFDSMDSYNKLHGTSTDEFNDEGARTSSLSIQFCAGGQLLVTLRNKINTNPTRDSYLFDVDEDNWTGGNYPSELDRKSAKKVADAVSQMNDESKWADYHYYL